MQINTRLQSEKTTTKSQLSAHYQVDRATLNNWLRLFVEDGNNLKNRRKFTDLEVEEIKKKLGTELKSFRKSDLVRIAETDYKTIRENVKKYPLEYGINESIYRSLDKFPPKIGQQIIDALG
jgi:predicted DNA binding CopG/RHH family protein